MELRSMERQDVENVREYEKPHPKHGRLLTAADARDDQRRCCRCVRFKRDALRVGAFGQRRRGARGGRRDCSLGADMSRAAALTARARIAARHGGLVKVLQRAVLLSEVAQGGNDLSRLVLGAVSSETVIRDKQKNRDFETWTHGVRMNGKYWKHVL